MPMTACPPIEIAVAFATTLDTPKHVALAEQLGFARACLAAQRTQASMCLRSPSTTGSPTR
jgi:hypothetical protein